MMSRRAAMRGAAIGLSGLMMPVTGYTVERTAHGDGVAGPPLPAFYADVERRTFDFFWERTNAANGLVPDRWPTAGAPCSIAAIGFGLSAYIIGVERGWISRMQARERTLTTLRFLSALPKGDATSGVAGHRGFFYHFLDMETGMRVGRCELSTVDSALMFLGMLHAAAWFDSDHPAETELRQLATDMVEAADWQWFQRGGETIPMGWHPESGFIDRNWDGYNEGKLVCLLALGSARHPASDGTWDAWVAPYSRFWRGDGPTRRLAFAPLFGHQYSEMWIDFRGIRDATMREAGFDYFENSRRATIFNRAWCMANPMGWDGYGPDIWGLTACDGPGGPTISRGGAPMELRGYSARGPVIEPDGFDDGTIAPTAALGSLPFAPDICIRAAAAMRQWPDLYGRYGYRDAFNPSFRDTTRAVDNGTVSARHGWVGGDWLGIDQGPILGMAANYRSGTIWRVMHRSPTIIRGLKRAGFSGGWIDQASG